MHFYDVAVYSQNEHQEQSVTNLQKRSCKGLCNLLAHPQLEIAEKLLNRGEVRYTPFLLLIQFFNEQYHKRVSAVRSNDYYLCSGPSGKIYQLTGKFHIRIREQKRLAFHGRQSLIAVAHHKQIGECFLITLKLEQWTRKKKNKQQQQQNSENVLKSF